MAGKSKYTFESKIHVYRATKRMTQQELADLVGVSRQTIMQLERNRYNPSMLLAYSIAKVFERGRKIIAIASLSAFLALFIIMNVLGGFLGNGWGIENVTRTMNLLQTGYTIVLLVADVAILIVRKTKI